MASDEPPRHPLGLLEAVERCFYVRIGGKVKPLKEKKHELHLLFN
jgi:hypothetical protein